MSALRLRADPSLRMLNDPMSTDPYSRRGSPYRAGSAASVCLIRPHSADVNCAAISNPYQRRSADTGHLAPRCSVAADTGTAWLPSSRSCAGRSATSGSSPGVQGFSF